MKQIKPELIKKKIKKIRIVGYGYVGKAMANFFKDHFSIVIQDKDYIKHLDQAPLLTERANPNCDLALICVPTPMRRNGECNLSIVRSVLKQIPEKYILIKSTVPPGTTKQLNGQYRNKHICFSPEYIGEGKYMVQWWKNYPHPTDVKYHSFQIFGGEQKAVSYISEFFKEVLGPDCKYMFTDSTTAEIVKYAENSWGATKVIFANEFYEICKAFGVNYDEMRELLLLDGRVEAMHTMVFKNKRGFGGKCYPKDVNAIVKASENKGFIPALLKQVLKSNRFFRSKNK